METKDPFRPHPGNVKYAPSPVTPCCAWCKWASSSGWAVRTCTNPKTTGKGPLLEPECGVYEPDLYTRLVQLVGMRQDPEAHQLPTEGF